MVVIQYSMFANSIEILLPMILSPCLLIESVLISNTSFIIYPPIAIKIVETNRSVNSRRLNPSENTLVPNPGVIMKTRMKLMLSIKIIRLGHRISFRKVVIVVIVVGLSLLFPMHRDCRCYLVIVIFSLSWLSFNLTIR